MRTSSYLATVIHPNSFTVERLKQDARVENARRRYMELAGAEGARLKTESGFWVKRRRIVCKGRLGKNNPYAPLYRKGGIHWRPAAMNIRPEHATRFDVYAVDRWVPSKAVVRVFIEN